MPSAMGRGVCPSGFHKQRMIAPYNPEARITDQTVLENEAKKEFFDIFAIQLRPRECRNPADRRVDLNKCLNPYRHSARLATRFGSNGVRGNLAVGQIQDETSMPSWVDSQDMPGSILRVFAVHRLMRPQGICSLKYI